ncbi:MAG TPA: transposase [Acetobacteraceae bacterium]|nr:transposase [Acetobacteraceae bacterium]
MRPCLFWLSDEQWAKIRPHLPTDVRGKPRVAARRVISGILHVLRCGCRRCDCPPEYGPHSTIYNRFVRGRRFDRWQATVTPISTETRESSEPGSRAD